MLFGADLASGHRSDILTNLRTQDASSKLPTAPFAWIGTKALMKWGEWAAGTELSPLSRRQANHRPRLWRFEVKILTCELSPSRATEITNRLGHV